MNLLKFKMTSILLLSILILSKQPYASTNQDEAYNTSLKEDDNNPSKITPSQERSIKVSGTSDFNTKIEELLNHQKEGTLCKKYKADWEELCQKINDKIPHARREELNRLINLHTYDEAWDRKKLTYAFAGALSLLSNSQDLAAEINKAFGDNEKELFIKSRGYQLDYNAFTQLQEINESLFNNNQFLALPFYEGIFTFNQYFQSYANKVTLLGISFDNHEIHGGNYKLPLVIFLHDLLHEMLIGNDDFQGNNLSIIADSIQRSLSTETDGKKKKKLQAGWFIMTHEGIFMTVNTFNLLSDEESFNEVFQTMKSYFSNTFNDGLAGDEDNYLEFSKSKVYREFLDIYYNSLDSNDVPSMNDVEFSILNEDENSFAVKIVYQDKEFSSPFLNFQYEKSLRSEMIPILKYAGYAFTNEDSNDYSIIEVRNHILNLIDYTQEWSMACLFDKLKTSVDPN